MTDAALARASSVLVVDDSEGSRVVFASWLRREGYTVIEAATGAEALAQLGQSTIDLAVLDIHLPDMSGLQICDHIKSNRATAAIPVLHISATATSPQDRSTALNGGADGYLIEPIERDELLASVAALLRYYDARRTAVRLAARLEHLHQASLLMNAAVTISELTQFAVTGLVDLFGSAAAVLVARGPSGHVATAVPNQIDPVLEIWAVDDVLELARSARAGEPVDIAAISPELGALARDPVASPITTPRGELVGVVVVLSGESMAGDELMLDHFSQAFAVALENQRLYAVEHQIALTLQRAMLPKVIPQPAGLQIAARYQAASDTAEIGGDFYEVFPISADRTLLAVGDVVGHSLHAATIMAELRYSLRAFAALGLSAPDIIGRLNGILCDSHPGATATMCIAEIDSAAGVVRVTNAGHIPPVIRTAVGVAVIAGHGPLLGIRSPRPTPTEECAFAPGSLLVLVTDGLIERRAENVDLGLGRLQAAVGAHDGDPEQLCETLLADIGSGADILDDVAIVVARSAS